MGVVVVHGGGGGESGREFGMGIGNAPTHFMLWEQDSAKCQHQLPRLENFDFLITARYCFH